MRHGVRWTKEQDQYLLDNYSKVLDNNIDLCVSDIGKILGRSRCSVIGRARRLRLQTTNDKKPSWNKFTKIDELKQLAAEGKVATQIADRLGFKSSTIKRYARKHGITFNRRRGMVIAGGYVPPENGRKRQQNLAKSLLVPNAYAWYLKSDGKYLHMSGQTLTSDRNYAWKNRDVKIAAMRAQSPIDGLQAVRVMG